MAENTSQATTGELKRYLTNIILITDKVNKVAIRRRTDSINQPSYYATGRESGDSIKILRKLSDQVYSAIEDRKQNATTKR